MKPQEFMEELRKRIVFLSAPGDSYNTTVGMRQCYLDRESFIPDMLNRLSKLAYNNKLTPSDISIQNSLQITIADQATQNDFIDFKISGVV